MTDHHPTHLHQEKDILIAFKAAYQRCSPVLVHDPGQTTSQMFDQMLTSDNLFIQNIIQTTFRVD